MSGPRLTIGTWVRLRGFVEAVYGEFNGRQLVRRDLPEVQKGQVTGAKHMREGRIVDNDDGRHFEARGSFLVYEVRLGVTNRPILAFPDQLLPCHDHPAELPWRFSEDPGGWRRYREDTAREVRAMLLARELDKGKRW